MSRRIIVGFDDSEGAHDALALGRVLADRTGSELVVAGVVPDRAAEQDLAYKAERAADMADARFEVVASSSPAHGLHDLAEDMEADIVVLGSSKANAGRVRAGRTAMHLLHGSPAAVALAPMGYRYDEPALRVLGVGVDGSPESLEALHAAIDLADGGTLRLMSVAARPATGYWGYGSWGYGLQELGEAALDTARASLDEAVAEVPAELRPATAALTGDAASALRAEADKGIDMLCLGSRGFGPVSRVLLGSVSAAVVKDAPCPVLVVPRSGARRPGEQAAARPPEVTA